MTVQSLTPSTAAYQLTKVLNVFATAHGTPRFPIDVETLAYEAASLFHSPDPITSVKAAPIPSFEGALFANDDKSEWMLLYNQSLRSPGRIRFTQAHELGHYVLHRASRNMFECTASDMVDLTDDEFTIESQADVFASTLLMPLDDFRMQMGKACDFDALGECAERYGVSLTAATLRWLKHTSAAAILVVHRDGFIDWAYSSRAAFEGGAYFKTRGRMNAIPDSSLASNLTIEHERTGKEVVARTWFPHAPADLTLREMKICADQYDYVMTLLLLPRGSHVWKPRGDGD